MQTGADILFTPIHHLCGALVPQLLLCYHFCASRLCLPRDATPGVWTPDLMLIIVVRFILSLFSVAATHAGWSVSALCWSFSAEHKSSHQLAAPPPLLTPSCSHSVLSAINTGPAHSRRGVEGVFPIDIPAMHHTISDCLSWLALSHRSLSLSLSL
jgi:hypothetical protein